MTRSYQFAALSPPVPLSEPIGRRGLFACVEIHGMGHGLDEAMHARTIGEVQSLLTARSSWTAHVRLATTVVLLPCTGGEIAERLAIAFSPVSQSDPARGALHDLTGACDVLGWSALNGEREASLALWRNVFPDRRLHEQPIPSLQIELGNHWSGAPDWLRHGTLLRSDGSVISTDLHAHVDLPSLLPVQGDVLEAA